MWEAVGKLIRSGTYLYIYIIWDQNIFPKRFCVLCVVLTSVVPDLTRIAGTVLLVFVDIP